MRTALFVVMAAFAAVFVAIWATSIARRREAGRVRPSWIEIGIGFITNLLDTLGIGSFATTTTLYKCASLVDDGQIPGTLMVGHTPPSILEAFIFIAVVQVDFATMALMIAASAIGAWLGAGVVSRLPRRKIRIGMGLALGGAAFVFTLTALHMVPGGGDALGLSGGTLLVAIACNLIFGALMTLGIGLYAPCMMLVSLLGMNPRAAFPIMTGSCAVLMCVGAVPFIRNHRYNVKAALGLTTGGLPGVLIAAFVVKSLPIDTIRWLVIAVVLYTSVMMLRSAMQEAKSEALPSAALAD